MFGLQLMLNPCQMIYDMQCPGSSCLVTLCAHHDLYGIQVDYACPSCPGQMFPPNFECNKTACYDIDPTVMFITVVETCGSSSFTELEFSR
jgi:hypothetical protein